MRIESSRPAKNGGWLHLPDKAWPRSVERKIVMPVLVKKLDCNKLLGRWNNETTTQVEALAETLGVTLLSLTELEACWAEEHQAFAFPMRDDSTEVVGIRLRSPERKWAVKGSKAALFIPMEATKRLSLRLILITEGPTDTAAALSLGFFAIGRPSCQGSEEMISRAIAGLGTGEAVICYDNDAPGIKGAERLSKAIRCRTAKFLPPKKDLRTFLNRGGSHLLLESMLKDCIRQ